MGGVGGESTKSASEEPRDFGCSQTELKIGTLTASKPELPFVNEEFPTTGWRMERTTQVGSFALFNGHHYEWIYGRTPDLG